MASRFEARPLTPETFGDLEELFGRPGGSIVRGCWCMYYRRSGKTRPGSSNREELLALSRAGIVPGLVGYLDGVPVGWISLGPRGEYPKLERSPIMKPVDDEAVWSIVCTFVDKAHRGHGLQRKLLAAAIDYARSRGVRLLEHIRSTRHRAATTTSCSSAREVCTSVPAFAKSLAGHRPVS
jgi:GNAT superfamily N-acetyltransferase